MLKPIWTNPLEIHPVNNPNYTAEIINKHIFQNLLSLQNKENNLILTAPYSNGKKDEYLYSIPHKTKAPRDSNVWTDVATKEWSFIVTTGTILLILDISEYIVSKYMSTSLVTNNDDIWALFSVTNTNNLREVLYVFPTQRTILTNKLLGIRKFIFKNIPLGNNIFKVEVYQDDDDVSLNDPLPRQVFGNIDLQIINL